MKDRKKPTIRFKGFTEDWEQRKVNEICSISTGKSNTQDKIDDGKYPFYVRSPIIERSNRYLYDEEAVLTVGDGVGTGKVFHYVNGKYDIHQRVYRLFDFSDDIDAKFFYHWFSENFYNRVMYMTAKTSVDSVRLEMIADMEITAPSYDEQKKISSYLDNFDNLITLHQRKYDKLVNVKKSMLEKMFPRDGKIVPDIRFSGFTEDWEQRMVSQLFKVTRGYVLAATQTETEKTDEKPYPVYSSQTKDKGLMGYYKDYLYEDAITWTTDGANAGTVNYRAGKFYCTNVCGVLLSNEVKANQMIAEALNNIAKRYVSYVGNPKLMNNVMADIVIQMPIQVEEREQLSLFFTNIDNLITLHQRKLEKLKNIKKSCLEKMFI